MRAFQRTLPRFTLLRVMTLTTVVLALMSAVIPLLGGPTFLNEWLAVVIAIASGIAFIAGARSEQRAREATAAAIHNAATRGSEFRILDNLYQRAPDR